jgi:hypothetical protein
MRNILYKFLVIWRARIDDYLDSFVFLSSVWCEGLQMLLWAAAACTYVHLDQAESRVQFSARPMLWSKIPLYKYKGFSGVDWSQLSWSYPTTRHEGSWGRRGIARHKMGWVEPRAAFCPGVRTSGTHCTGGWVDPRPGLDTELQEKSFRLCRESNLGRPVVQPITRHYTAWATLAHDGSQHILHLSTTGCLHIGYFWLYLPCNPMGTGGPFLGGKARPGRDADHSPPSSAEVGN